jgi:hypothetical protein
MRIVNQEPACNVLSKMEKSEFDRRCCKIDRKQDDLAAANHGTSTIQRPPASQNQTGQWSAAAELGCSSALQPSKEHPAGLSCSAKVALNARDTRKNPPWD